MTFDNFENNFYNIELIARILKLFFQKCKMFNFFQDSYLTPVRQNNPACISPHGRDLFAPTFRPRPGSTSTPTAPPRPPVSTPIHTPFTQAEKNKPTSCHDCSAYDCSCLFGSSVNAVAGSSPSSVVIMKEKPKRRQESIGENSAQGKTNKR